MRVHNEEGLDIDATGLATLEGFLEFLHDRLVETVFRVGVGIFNLYTRLVEEVQLETAIHGSACQEDLPRVGEGPGERVVHGSG